MEGVEPAVEAADELVEAGLEMPCADAVVGAAEPVLQVAEDEVDDRQEPFGHLGVAAFGDGVVIEAPRPQAATGAPGRWWISAPSRLIRWATPTPAACGRR